MDLADNGAALAAPDAGTVDSATPSNAEVIKDNSWDSIDKTMDTAYDKINPAREPTGQFKGAADAEPEGAVEGDQPKPEASPAAASTEPTPSAIVAPQSLPADLKADWEKAPPSLQSWAAQREADSHKRISELGQTAKAFEPFRQLTDHYQAEFQKRGIAPAQAFQLLMEAQIELDRDFDTGIRKLAEAYGRPLPGSEPTAEGQESGEVRSLKATIQRLERQVGETHNTVMARVNAEKEQAQASLSKLVNDFAAGKDDFKDIEDSIAAHIAAIRNAEPDLEPKALLDKAYEAARWANPVTRTRMLESERKAEEAKRTEANKAKADAAKKASNLNVKSGNGASPTKKASWEDTMSAAADRIYGN